MIWGRGSLGPGAAGGDAVIKFPPRLQPDGCIRSSAGHHRLVGRGDSGSIGAGCIGRRQLGQRRSGTSSHPKREHGWNQEFHGNDPNEIDLNARKQASRRAAASFWRARRSGVWNYRAGERPETGHAPKARTRSDESGRTFGTVAAAALEQVAQRGQKKRRGNGARQNANERRGHGRMAGDRTAVSTVLRRSSARAGASAVIAERLRCFRETGRGCRGVFVLRLRNGCYSFDWRTQFGAHMTTVGRRNASGDHPRHKRKQNCLCEFPKGKGGGHGDIDDQRWTSCQSTESRGRQWRRLSSTSRISSILSLRSFSDPAWNAWATQC